MTAQEYEYVRGGASHGPVVVGVDGSGTDEPAVAWAALTAARHRVPLRVVHSNEVAVAGAVQDDPAAGSDETLSALREHGEAPRVADQLVEKVRAQYPGVDVEAVEAAGAASQALMDQQESALVLVVGSGRRGGIGERILGSTSLNIAMHAACPVAVVNPGVDVSAEPVGRIVVGVDGSRDSAAAAEIAWATAAARGARVACISTWYLEVVGGVVITDEDSEQRDVIETRQRERVEAAIRAAREDFPDVPYDVEILNGPSSKVLAAQSDHADVLVIGTRGRGGFAGKLLGSVSHKVLQAARCPVVVVKSRPEK
ncbi:universal stress protein [Luteipulveratus sp. YIM 133132]|uniref:universal stress protein n=1 Tax=Luteipulveratus flavus TaxID=3031728 RepID=UPI0023B04E66|nr:universal stress protein [Luteipulveratus sp. YIM 133132]MDE9367275.1 universal stress protein [Luteipulveratus sp. YIM 133132]